LPVRAATRAGETAPSDGTASSRGAGLASDLFSPAALGYGLLFLILFTPTTYTSIKAILLALTLLALGLRFILTGTPGIHPAVLCRSILFSGAGLFFVLVGLLRGNPGALPMAGVFAAWPLVYTVLLGGLDDRRRRDRIVQLLVFSTIAVEFSMYDFLLSEAGILPVSFTQSLRLGQAVSSDFREFNLNSIASLLFLVPFLISALVIWPRSDEMPVRRRWIWLATMLALPLVLLSGRRALWISVGAAPLVALLFRIWLRRGRLSGFAPWRRLLTRGLVAGVLLLMALQAVTGLQPGDIWSTLRQGFDFSTGDAGLGRAIQFQALIKGWSESPLIGKGLGAVLPGIIRSEEQPWSYELVYVVVLYTTGIVGVALYCYGGLWVLRQAGRMIRDGDPGAPVLLAVLVGSIGAVLASATNQYLVKFDGLWTVFLPIALINHWLLARPPTKAKTG
jgi:hypothetical protein